MSVAVLVMTDGRDDYLAECLASACRLRGPVTEWWMHDDTGDPSYRRWLARQHPDWRVIHAGPRAGFGGAVRSAWRQLRQHTRADWVFHLEQDFRLERDVPLGDMAAVLADRPWLAQMALRRQAWSPAERAAGGIVEQHPDDYTDVHELATGRSWLEHTRFFTTNPCLYPLTLTALGWPTGAESEGRFGIRLREHGLPGGMPGWRVRFGFWGRREDPPWVTHIGHRRAGTGY